MEFVFIFILIIIAVVFFVIFSVGLIIYFIAKNSSVKNNMDYKRKVEKNPLSKKHKKDGIQRIRFDSCKNGLHTAGRERAMLDASEADASNWIDNHPEIEIINISSTIGGMNASVTVWYKFKAIEDNSSKSGPNDTINKYGPGNNSDRNS